MNKVPAKKTMDCREIWPMLRLNWRCSASDAASGGAIGEAVTARGMLFMNSGLISIRMVFDYSSGAELASFSAPREEVEFFVVLKKKILLRRSENL